MILNELVIYLVGLPVPGGQTYLYNNLRYVMPAFNCCGSKLPYRLEIA